MGHSEEKLKKLLNAVPQGFLIDTPWLAAKNIDRKRAHYYVKKGWLKGETQGLYRRPYAASENQQIKSDWKTTILSMQTLMRYDVHIGSETALNVAGFRHYLRMSKAEDVYLYGTAPSWIKRIKTDYHFILRSRKLFNDETLGLKDAFSVQDNRRNINTDITPPWEWPLIMSSPERAILEMLKELPKQTSFHNVDMIFESLTNLKPSLVERLLLSCQSIKTKRLFFVFADRHKHAWWKHVRKEQINLGKGPRSLIKDGGIHPNYHISVPKDFLGSKGEGSQP